MPKRSIRAASTRHVPLQAKEEPTRWPAFSARAGVFCALLTALGFAYSFPSHKYVEHPGVVQEFEVEFENLEAELKRGDAKHLPPMLAKSESQDTLRKFAYQLSHKAEVRVRGERWSFEEMEGRVVDRFADSPVLRTSPLVSEETVGQLLELSRKIMYEEGPDTVDKHPTFEAPLFRDGLSLTQPQYIKSLSKMIEHRALPYVRERFNCSACVACTSIIRRYLHGERRAHPHHYDSDAFVTMVMPLTAAADYRGGLFVQPSFDRNDREFVELEAGDAVFHSFDVMHGVEMLSGERTSLIIWFKSDADACKRKLSTWYADGAARGNPTAQYNFGRVVANGLGGTPEDKPAGVEWYTKAAKQGHVMAMYNLGVCLHHGRGVASDKEAAVAWYAQAAHSGHPLAMTNYGYMQLFGHGMPKKNMTGAAFWFHKGALQGIDKAMFQLSHLLAQGNGIQRNMSEAERWLEQAALLGHEDSKIALLRLRTTGLL